MLFCIQMDLAFPIIFAFQTISESILGDSGSRWYDKGCQLIVYKNGYNGNNMDVSVVFTILEPQSFLCYLESLETGRV